MGAAPFKGLWQNQLQNVANPHNALVLANPNQTNYHSALELAAAQLNNELSSFKETFPMLKDGDPIVIIPIQYLDKLNNFIKDQISDVLASTIKKLDFNPSEAFSIFNRNLKSNNTIFPLNQNIPKEIVDVVNTHKDTISVSKPFGDWGDQALNKIAMDAWENGIFNSIPFEEIFSNKSVWVGISQIISVGLLFKLAVNTYATNVYPMSTLDHIPHATDRLNWLNMRSRNVRNFSIVMAPVLAALLYSKFQSKTIIAEEIKKKIGPLESSIFFISKPKFKLFNRNLSSTSSNSNHNDFNKYSWYGLLITFILFGLTWFVSIKSILFYYILFSFIYLIFITTDFIIFLMFINKKLTVPSYLPDYLYNWLLRKEVLSQSDNKVIRAFLDLDLRNIIVTLLFLIFLIVYYLYL